MVFVSDTDIYIYELICSNLYKYFTSILTHKNKVDISFTIYQLKNIDRDKIKFIDNIWKKYIDDNKDKIIDIYKNTVQDTKKQNYIPGIVMKSDRVIEYDEIIEKWRCFIIDLYEHKLYPYNTDMLNYQKAYNIEEKIY